MERSVLTLGTFDCPHIGHVSFLRKCEAFGTVTIGLNSDEFIMQYKGAFPIFSYDERAALLRGMDYPVDKNDGPGRDLIEKLQPDVIVIGSDWLRKDYLKQIDITPDYLEMNEITLVYVPYTEGISTSEIKKRLS